SRGDGGLGPPRGGRELNEGGGGGVLETLWPVPVGEGEGVMGKFPPTPPRSGDSAEDTPSRGRRFFVGVQDPAAAAGLTAGCHGAILESLRLRGRWRAGPDATGPLRFPPRRPWNTPPLKRGFPFQTPPPGDTRGGSPP